MKNKILFLVLPFILLLTAFTAAPQKTQSEEEYTRVITQRSEKIVQKLGIADTVKALKVRTVIVQQYRAINAAHENFSAKVNQIKQKSGEDKEDMNSRIATLESNLNQRLDSMHGGYLHKLSKELNAGQVEIVKNEMTYNVLPVTYKAYMDMLPNLSSKQKSQINDWLVEAREHAMDAGSSDKKHWWFGKYKGKINNYLSREGINLEKARAEWEARLKEKQASQKK
jgi:hypothetical protein